jgi:hypothetical protein
VRLELTTYRLTAGRATDCAIQELRRQKSVAGVMVSIAAFQAVDPGSIPGPRIFFARILLCVFFWGGGGAVPNSCGSVSRVSCLCQESELAQRFSALGS